MCMWYCLSLAANHAGQNGHKWWADALYVAVSCLVGSTAVAGYGAAAAYVGERIAALRAKHQAPERHRGCWCWRLHGEALLQRVDVQTFGRCLLVLVWVLPLSWPCLLPGRQRTATIIHLGPLSMHVSLACQLLHAAGAGQLWCAATACILHSM
jgi:hypothetical protein